MGLINIDLTAHPMDLSVFLEPRGFMRFLQLSFSVFAYAAVKSFEGFVDIKFCDGQQTAHLVYSYPFTLSDVSQELEKACSPSPSPQPKFIGLDGDFALESKLFIFTCWISFLYCLAIIYTYVKLTPYYESNVKWPITDFVASLAISGLWILFFVVWANAVSGIKEATDSSHVKSECDSSLRCTKVTPSPYFGLNASIAIGLINLILWTSNQWFLFKETPWFSGSGPVVGFRSGRPTQQI